MSVAFRRESDEEHKEPRFELPIPSGPNLVTPRGLALIEARVAELEGGPLDDDAKRTLRYWRARLATAHVAPPPPLDEVAFGSRVRIRLNGKTRELSIVGDDEANPAGDRIAFSAPLAQAIIGAGAGEAVPFGPGTVEIVALLAPNAADSVLGS